MMSLFSILIGLVAAFLTINNQGAWDFILTLRGEKILLLLLVAYAVGVSTLLFQTLTNNPILTPGILGFDSLYLLLQTVLVFLMGTTAFTRLDIYSRFLLDNLVMIGASLLLFRVLIRFGYKDLTRMILIGVVFATLFRSLNSVFQRILDPTVFVVLQTKQFAQFTSVKLELLWIGVTVAVMSALWLWKRRYELDVLMLGRSHAIALGVNYNRFSFVILVLIAILVAMSTALVGPVSFFGFLICAIANAIAPTMSHSVRLPITVLLAGIMLVGGQLVFEQFLGMRSVLSVVIEFFGGCVFMWLIFHQKKNQQV